MAYKIFGKIGLFKTFSIPVEPFIEFFTSLENGYLDLPCKWLFNIKLNFRSWFYCFTNLISDHNKIHAADVMHACYFFISQGVPNFIELPSATSKFFRKQREPLSIRQFSPVHANESNETAYGSVGINFNPLELLALFCSAAMHDYEHPGRTNQFLIAISSPLVIIFDSYTLTFPLLTILKNNSLCKFRQ
jgi:cGMP-inhibited 3',5'-cyclic phosphodiesterase A